jgi:NAD(P)-dependent dehydrogenase (short-subunit alcohol dehydrogenase family)
MTAGKKGATETRKPVWFITGCSTGFGRVLAQSLLQRGDSVAVTARNPESISDLARMGDALVLKLDVTDQDQIADAVKAAEDRFGHIDVLVNNAGIGYFAAVEESEEAQVRKMFEINVFGLGRVIKETLPGMRMAGRGQLCA